MCGCVKGPAASGGPSTRFLHRRVDYGSSSRLVASLESSRPLTCCSQSEREQRLCRAQALTTTAAGQRSTFTCYLLSYGTSVGTRVQLFALIKNPGWLNNRWKATRFLKRGTFALFSWGGEPIGGRASTNHVFSKKASVTKLKLIAEALAKLIRYDKKKSTNIIC